MLRLRFTLVELLVVVAIIMVLMSLLLPALSKVKDFGHRTACAGNLKQLGMGIVMYTDQYGYTPKDCYGPADSRWYWHIQELLGVTNPSFDCGIMRCKAQPNGNAFSYGYNQNWNNFHNRMFKRTGVVLTAGDCGTFYFSQTNVNAPPEFRHSGGVMSAVYLDGHTGTVKYSEWPPPYEL
jgi:prepilin-type processing-associated H-X9-DG protein